MKIVFLVFSGTGNTERICKAMQSVVVRRGFTTEYHAITRKTMQEDLVISSDDSIVIGYPIHAFNAPRPVIERIKRLSASSAQIWFVKTSGEFLKLNSASSVKPARLLRRKGYVVQGEFHYLMPYHIMTRHSDSVASLMLRTALARIEDDTTDILSGRRHAIEPSLGGRIVSGPLKIEQLAFPFIGHAFHATSRCIGCGLCAQVCPTENIVMAQGHPTFGFRCVGCMACSVRCPVNAVDLGIFDGWKIYGAYDFDAVPAKPDKLPRYCNRSYRRYFYDSAKVHGGQTSASNQ